MVFGERRDKGRTVVMDIHAGRSKRGSEEAPESQRTEDVRYAMRPFVARRRIRTAGGL